MDIATTIRGTTKHVYVSVTNALSECEDRVRNRANAEGKAARATEVEKLGRYSSSIVPFVCEAHGRLGQGALNFLNAAAPQENRPELFAEVYHTIQRIMAAHVADIIIAAAA